MEFASAWQAATGETERPSAPAMDRHLRTDRVVVTAGLGGLPAGCMIEHNAEAWLVVGNELRRWSPEGYTDATEFDDESTVRVLTPSPIVAVLTAGYVPRLHETARPT